MMVNIIKASFDVALDEPLRALPVLGDVLQRGVTAQSGPETMGVGVELRLVVCFQEAAHHFLQQFVGPCRHAEGTHLPVGFREGATRLAALSKFMLLLGVAWESCSESAGPHL